jgi:hypothetical protein
MIMSMMGLNKEAVWREDVHTWQSEPTEPVSMSWLPLDTLSMRENEEMLPARRLSPATSSAESAGIN